MEPKEQVTGQRKNPGPSLPPRAIQASLLAAPWPTFPHHCTGCYPNLLREPCLLLFFFFTRLTSSKAHRKWIPQPASKPCHQTCRKLVCASLTGKPTGPTGVRLGTWPGAVSMRQWLLPTLWFILSVPHSSPEGPQTAEKAVSPTDCPQVTFAALPRSRRMLSYWGSSTAPTWSLCPRLVSLSPCFHVKQKA